MPIAIRAEKKTSRCFGLSPNAKALSSYKKKKNIEEDNIIMSANTWSLQNPHVAFCHYDLLKKAGVNPKPRKGNISRFHRSLLHVQILKTDMNQAAPVSSSSH